MHPYWLVQKKCPLFEFPSFLLHTNLGHQMHSQPALTELPSPNLAPFLLLHPVQTFCQCAACIQSGGRRVSLLGPRAALPAVAAGAGDRRRRRQELGFRVGVQGRVYRVTHQYGEDLLFMY